MGEVRIYHGSKQIVRFPEQAKRLAVSEGLMANDTIFNYIYWTIGEVFERLIEDVDEGDVIKTLAEVYHSWMSDAISNYNSDLFYQSRDYISACYQAGEIL